MATHFHALSGKLFYLLGLSFFVAYLLMVNGVTAWAGWWMRVADLPLALVAVVYGGTSLYRSVQPEGEGSMGLTITIGLPLAVVFVFLCVLNFWPSL